MARTSIVPIIEAVYTQLTASSYKIVTSPETVWLIRRRKVLPDSFIGYPAVALQYGGMKPHQGSSDGAGRNSSWCRRNLTVFCITRSDLDQVKEDKYRLTGTNIGHYQFEEAVDNALQIFFQSQLGSLLVEPARLVDGTDAMEGANSSYTISTMIFELIYERSLDVTLQ